MRVLRTVDLCCQPSLNGLPLWHRTPIAPGAPRIRPDSHLEEYSVTLGAQPRLARVSAIA